MKLSRVHSLAMIAVQKTRMVEQAGGDVAIIVDNIIEPVLPYMADDGSKPPVTIPAVLIVKQGASFHFFASHSMLSWY